MPVVTHSGSGAPRGVRRPPRHLRHPRSRGGRPAAVVHAVVGRVRALPRAALRRHRGGLLVAAVDAVVLGPPDARPEGHREARRQAVRRGRTCCRREYVDRNCFIGASQHQAARARACATRSASTTSVGATTSRTRRAPGRTRGLAAKTFGDMPIDETRRMLGLNAAEVFGFDVEALTPHRQADRPDPGRSRSGHGGGPDGARLDDRWAAVKDVGRHWLTGHDFALIP